MTSEAGRQLAQRLAAHRAQLLAGGWLTLSQLAARRGEHDVTTTGAWAAARVVAGELLAVTGRADDLIVPTFQLTADGAPRQDLTAVLKSLRASGVDGWAAWTWLTSPTSFLSGEVPEQVAATDTARVVRAATRFAAA